MIDPSNNLPPDTTDRHIDDRFESPRDCPDCDEIDHAIEVMEKTVSKMTQINTDLICCLEKLEAFTAPEYPGEPIPTPLKEVMAKLREITHQGPL